MCRVGDDNSLHCVQIGVGFSYYDTFNALLEVEWMGGNSEMTEEEYDEQHYRCDQLRPETGGHYFSVRLKGAGYRRRSVSMWTYADGLPRILNQA